MKLRNWIRQAGVGMLLAAAPTLSTALADEAGHVALGEGRTVEQALQIELTADGLNLIAGMVKDQAPGSIQLPLPDQAQDLPYGVTVSLNGMSAALSIDSVALAPAQDTLQIAVGLRDVKVSIGELAVTKEVLGFPLSASCSGTDFLIAENDAVFLKLDLQPSVADTNIQLAADKAEFKIGADQYRVEGPAECRGTLILDGLLRQVMHQIFGMIRPVLAKVIEAKVKEFLPTIADELNKQTHLSVEIDLKGLPALPDRTAEISAFPTSVTIDGSALKAEVGVKIREVTRQRDSLEAMPLFGEGSIRYGAVGVNPGILTAAFAELYEGGTDWVEIDENTIPAIKDLLTKEGLSSIWPDLLQAQTDAPYLKVAVRLADTPVIKADEDLQAITVHIPKIQLKFQIRQEGDWIDYFVMDLDVKTGIKAVIEGSELKISLIEHNAVAVEGRWADGYDPMDPTFEKDTAQAVFAALLEIAASQGPLFKMEVPAIPLGGKDILLSRPHVQAPYFRIDLTGN